MRSLPVVSGSCPSCGSDDVRPLSSSPATGELLQHCGECGDQWWEDDLSHPRNLSTLDDEKAAA
jgi:uncharacterized Zn finger protein